MNPDDVDLEAHLGIEAGRLNDRARRQLAEFVANREGRLAELRERALDAEQEAEALRTRVQTLSERVEALEQETGGRSETGPDLDTESLVATFGDALASERIGGSGFTVSDLSVDLRANVVSTDEGVRVTLPEPGSRPAPESLSELRFSVRSDPAAGEPDLAEVPDLVGMTEDGAGETLRTAGFEVGSVEAVAAEADPGRVVGQLPSPFSLAAPGAPVDLEVAAADDESVDLVGETFADVVRFVGDRFSLADVTAVDAPESPGTVLEQDPEPGAVQPGDRLSLTISAYPEAERTADEPAEAEERAESDEDEPEPTDDGTAGSRADEAHRSETEALLAAAESAVPPDADPLVERDVEEIGGIGDAYGERLRVAGFESLADLAVADPVGVADAANVSDDRAAAWVDAALETARALAGGETESDVDESGDEP
jgi:beta-lactam-binding protein with PASTA domain